MDTSFNGLEQETSFGIKKIVDCKIVEGGRQMYKVKWEPTWEPVENLATCQHLIDEFWSFVNKLKTKQESAVQHRKRMRLDINTNNVIGNHSNFHRLSEDNKAEVHRLIARTNTTSVGSTTLISPRSMLMSPQTNQLNGIQTPSPNQKPHVTPLQKNPAITPPCENVKFSNIGNKINTAPPAKLGVDAAANKATGMSSLKYLENFNNPYVKIIVVCKICNKEQSLKFVGNWKLHYMTHSDQKPHKCPHCPKTFVRADKMRKHVQFKHGDQNSMVPSKQEHMFVKEENFM